MSALLATAVVLPASLPIFRALLVVAYIVESSRFIRANGRQARHFNLVRVAVTLGLIGALLRLVHGVIVGEAYPFPSPADLFGYLFYVFLIWGGIELIRSRTRERNTEDWLDACLVGIVALSFQYCFVIDLYLFDSNQMLGTRLVNAGFALGTTGLIVVAARMSFGPGAKNGSYYCLAGAVAVALTNDSALQLQAAGKADLTVLTSVLGPLGIMFLVASVQHPGAVSLADRPKGVEQVVDVRRQVLTAGVIFYGLALVLYTAHSSGPAARLMAILAMITTILLTGWRTKLFLDDGRHHVEVEQRLREFTSESAEMNDLERVTQAALRLVPVIVPAAVAGRVFVVKGDTLAHCLAAIDQVPEALMEQSDLTSDGDGSLVIEDASLPFSISGSGSVAAVSDSTRTGGNALLYCESERLITQRELAALEALVVQLALLQSSIAAQEQLHQRRSNDRFRALVQDSNDIVALVNVETLKIEFVSPTLTRLLGYLEDRALGRPALAWLHPQDRLAVERRIEGTIDPLEIDEVDVRLQHVDGSFLWFSLSVRDLTTEPEVSGLLFSYADIHDRKMVELQMEAAEIRYRTLVTNSNDVMLLLDDGVITYLTPNVERVFGFTAADLIGVRANSFLDERGDAEVERLFSDDGLLLSGTDTVVQLPTAGGGLRWAQLTFLDPGLPGGEVMVTVRDITEQRRLEASLRDQALHDPLTGLFNRASVYPELQKALQGLERGTHLGVLHLDVHDFKSINDSLGFAAGDSLLVDIATRLRTVLRRSDTLARFSGDEFAVITLGSSSHHVAQLVERLNAVFDQPFDVGGRSVPVTVVIGAVLTEDRSEHASRLLESAGIALQFAKSNGRELAIFEESMREAASERFELASGLLGGIERGEFFVVYQPLLNLDSQKVSSTEALLRWQHPERGFVSPAVFIPLAEQSGAIVELGRWVLERACEQLADWHERLPAGRGLSMSINVSARQLERSGEADVLLDIIRTSGVDTTSLILELTESVMLEDANSLRAILEQFRSLGIRIAVDDFGTGAAGLGHLRDVPFDIVKIDKSYIDGLGESDEAHMLITGVIELAHGLNAKIVAEGIETPQQASLLKAMRCNYGQGFYLGRPMEAAQIEEWFARGRAGSAAASIVRPTEKGKVAH